MRLTYHTYYASWPAYSIVRALSLFLSKLTPQTKRTSSLKIVALYRSGSAVHLHEWSVGD